MFLKNLWSPRVAVLVFGLLIFTGGLRAVFSAATPSPSEMTARANFQALSERAAGGGAEAGYALAQAYRKGEGVKADPPVAARWYAKAARQGHLDAQYRLGLMYEAGQGIAPDYSRAARLFRQAGGLGNHPGAQFAMGRLYYHGLGVAPDYGAALGWFRKAAGQGHGGALFLLGDIYRHGWGVGRNREEAYKWYSLAMNRSGAGNVISIAGAVADPAAALAALAPSMTRAEIERAERAARDWRPIP
jgi:hypothetical protein